MYRRNSLSGLRVASYAFVIVLAGCGGGKGGGYSTTSTPSGSSYSTGSTTQTMPTVMLSSPTQASTIHLGQAVKLAWTANNASSCSVSSSSDIGGASSASQPAIGSITVAPVGSG